MPKVDLEVASTLKNANLSVDVYDIDAKNNALLLSRTAQLLGKGEQHVTPQMYGNDWKLPAGHRLGVLVTTANDEWWTPTPSLSTVTLLRGSITLPFLRQEAHGDDRRQAPGAAGRLAAGGAVRGRRGDDRRGRRARRSRCRRRRRRSGAEG